MITLAQAKLGMADKVDQNVADLFRRGSALLEALPFDDAVSPGTGGSTMTYGYMQLKTPVAGKPRKINEEYTPQAAQREKKTADIGIFGGSFQIDRVIAGTSGAVDEVQFQIEEQVKGATNVFHNKVINATTEGDVDEFDGLNKLLKSTKNEITSVVDISTSALLDTNHNAFIDELDGFISQLDGKPNFLFMNEKMLIKLRGAARRAGYYTRGQNSFGDNVEDYNGIIFMDLGKYYDGANTVDVVATTDGKSDIYAVTLDMNGFHGISPDGSKMIKTYLPDFKTPGAVKIGEVELLAAVVLKNANKAGVLRGVKIIDTTIVKLAQSSIVTDQVSEKAPKKV